jgi:hypothetical protein
MKMNLFEINQALPPMTPSRRDAGLAYPGRNP